MHIKNGIISSDVDKYTAISVPKLITLAAYKFVADAENPHCGIIPTADPSSGPSLPDLLIVCLDFSVILCSIYSIIKYVKNRNGNIFIASIVVSFKTSNIV